MQDFAGNNQQLIDSLIKKLGPDDKKKVESLLADKAACQKILNTPEAQKLIRELTGGK